MIETVFGPVEFGDFVAWLVVSAVATVFCFFGIFRYYRRARLIEDTPTSKVRSAAQGYVELEGQAEPLDGRELEAPLTRLPCVWYRYEIEKYVRRGKNSSWVTVEAETSSDPFTLVDDTGNSVIEPYGADVSPTIHDRWHGGTRWPAAGPSGAGQRAFFSSRRYRYTEERIISGEFLYALGWFESVSAARHAAEQGNTVRDLLAEWKADYESMVARFDANGDGELDLQEWEQARQAARAEVEARRIELDVAEAVHVLARPPGSEYPFLLGTHPQRDLAKRYRRYAAGCCAGFLVAGSVLVGLLESWL